MASKIKKIYKAESSGRVSYHDQLLELFKFFGFKFISSQDNKCRNLTQKLRNAKKSYQYQFALVEKMNAKKLVLYKIEDQFFIKEGLVLVPYDLPRSDERKPTEPRENIPQ